MDVITQKTKSYNMEHFNFSKKIYRVHLYDEGNFIGGYTVKDRLKLKREVHLAISNGYDCIIWYIGCESVHVKIFNHSDYVHSDS